MSQPINWTKKNQRANQKRKKKPRKTKMKMNLFALQICLVAMVIIMMCQNRKTLKRMSLIIAKVMKILSRMLLILNQSKRKRKRLSKLLLTDSVKKNMLI